MRGALKRSVCTVCGRVCIVVSRVCLTDRGFESGGSVLGLLSWSLSEPLGSIWTCSVANSIRWIVFTIHTEQTFFKRGSSWDPSDSEAIQGYSGLFHPNIGFQSYLFGCLGKTVLRSKCRRRQKKAEEVWRRSAELLRPRILAKQPRAPTGYRFGAIIRNDFFGCKTFKFHYNN